MKYYNEFKKLMNDYNSLLDKVLEIEHEKIKIIKAEDIEQLEKHMRLEEAETMRMKGFDSKREALLREMGFEGKTFKQIIELSAAEQKTELQPLFAQMDEKITRLKGLSGSISNMLKSKMVKMEAAEERMKNGEGRIAYDHNGGEIQPDMKPKMKPTKA